MSVKENIKKWLGIALSPEPGGQVTMRNKPAEKFDGESMLREQGILTDDEESMRKEIEAAYAVLDACYGSGFSVDNPAIVMQFIHAASVKKLAVALNEMAETFANGSGAITIGIDKG